MKDGKPEIGDEIYIDSRMFISRGSDDFVGGLAKVVQVSEGMSAGEMCTFVRVAEDPDWRHNWDHGLAPKQEELRERFGTQRAYPDPDEDRPWIEEGDIVNGKEYKGLPIW
jgi:hypothetical protein